MLASSGGEFFLLMLTEPKATFILKLGPIMQLSTLLRAKFPLLVKVPSVINTFLVAASIRNQKSSIMKACCFVILSTTFYLGFFLVFLFCASLSRCALLFMCPS